jgi:type IV pilus assembly protein PilP
VRERGRLRMRYKAIIICGVLGWGSLTALGENVAGEPGMTGHLRQMSPMRQDSLKVPSLNDADRAAPTPALMNQSANENGPLSLQGSAFETIGAHSYDPSGRRDPFAPIVHQLGVGLVDPTLPPLQRVGLTEMNLIAVVWGAYGYTAMVQTPDGNGYTVRRGTRVGPNNGVVSAITEKGIIVQERFTDVYGRKQEREYVKLLHPKEGAE